MGLFWRLYMKEIYLYSGIYDFTAERLIESMEEFKDEDISIRINSPGGNVFAGWGIASKMREHKGKVNIKVDGIAASMAAVLLPFANFVEVSDVTRIMIHKASGYAETEAEKELLDSINSEMKAKLKSKINNQKLKELKGYTIDSLFNAEERVDLWLTAKEAKAVGLVDKINKLNTSEAKAFENKMYQIAALDNGAKDKEKINTEKPVKMDLNKLQAEHPELYAQIVADAIAGETARIEAWMEWSEVDAEAVKTGISAGKAIGMKEISAFSKKMSGATAATDLEIESEKTPKATTEKVDPAKTEEPTALAVFEQKLNDSLGLNPEKK